MESFGFEENRKSMPIRQYKLRIGSGTLFESLVIGRCCCKSRKSNDAEDLAKADF